MTQDIVLDADFLSAFLKIDHLPLVREFYQAEALQIPSAVYGEVKPTRFFLKLASLPPWVRVTDPSPSLLESLSREPGFSELGLGEKEAIALAKQLGDSVLLMNDNRARLYATRLGLDCVSIPAFLLACKRTRLVDAKGVAELVHALQTLDRYRFRKDVLDLLLT